MAPWTRFWGSIITCGSCGAIYDPTCECPVCKRQPVAPTKDVGDPHHDTELPGVVYAGAIDWTTYLLLGMMETEWNRPAAPDSTLSCLPPSRRPSPRLVVVLLFWTMFEHLMDRFFRAATDSLPRAVASDLLSRYSGIGVRLDRLYPILFEAKFRSDLEALGYHQLHQDLSTIQSQRNQFMHGDPEAIDESLVTLVVHQLDTIQAAWVALYNFRCAAPGRPPRGWWKSR